MEKSFELKALILQAGKIFFSSNKQSAHTLNIQGFKKKICNRRAKLIVFN